MNWQYLIIVLNSSNTKCYVISRDNMPDTIHDIIFILGHISFRIRPIPHRRPLVLVHSDHMLYINGLLRQILWGRRRHRLDFLNRMQIFHPSTYWKFKPLTARLPDKIINYAVSIKFDCREFTSILHTMTCAKYYMYMNVS